MQFLNVALAIFFAAGVSAQAVRGPGGNCGFPDGPDCVSIGGGGGRRGDLEQFVDGDDSPEPGCCLLPLRCGNEAGERCERVEQ